MRSPQSSILSLLELYDRTPADKRDTALLHERIRRYARQGLALSEDFLQLARAEAGGLDRQLHDLHGLLDEAADTVWSLAQERQIRILLPEPNEEAECSVDPALVMRALALLLAGAVEFADDGAQIRCVIARSGATDDAWLISLRAPAPELAEDIGPAVEFARVAVQAHGGTFTVASTAIADSQPGTEFTIRLPRDGNRADSATND
ncbi:MAG: HAMP domain-containing histidine kinase [Rubrivivax sp.]|nr:MAG: HAMP domain-containing histidine kinase [Rubrivivax sp.]